jgi:hypothetical protein
MIEKEDYWTWSKNPMNQLDDPSTVGKWIFVMPLSEVEEIFPQIDELVEDGVLYKAKYPHQEHADYDFNRFPLPVVCVYADNYSKEETLRVMNDLGWESDEWRYDGGGEASVLSYVPQGMYDCMEDCLTPTDEPSATLAVDDPEYLERILDNEDFDGSLE